MTFTLSIIFIKWKYLEGFHSFFHAIPSLLNKVLLFFLAVKYTCYNAQDRLSEVRWIPNSHYSGIFALVKLLFPSILPNSLKQVIVLDSDLTFLSDIAELWDLFRNMTGDQVSKIYGWNNFFFQLHCYLKLL